MKCNMSFTDRGTRMMIGAALFLTAAFGAISPWGYLGIIPVLTAVFGVCPAYAIFGVSSRSPNDPD